MTVERILTGLMRPVGILLMSVAMVLTVVSCGDSDDVVTPDTPQPKPIAFSGSLSGSGSESASNTRATTPTPLHEYPDATHGHTTFQVWSYKNTTANTTEVVMQNYRVNWTSGSAGTSTTNSNGWEYVNQQASGGIEQSIKYWDFTAVDYRFFGYTGSGVSASYSPTDAPTSVSLTATIDASAYSPEATPSSTIPLFSKLWYKTGSGIAANIQPVTLEFVPPVARVRFLFRQSDASDTNLSLSEKSFRPTDDSKTIATAGTFIGTYPLTGTTEESWSVTSVTASLTIDGFTQDYYEADDGETDQDILDAEKKWYVVLPAHADDQGSYTLYVKVNGEDKTTIVPAQYMEWRPGYEYTYIFKIIDGATPAFYDVLAGYAPWNESVSSYTVYNW